MEDQDSKRNELYCVKVAEGHKFKKFWEPPANEEIDYWEFFIDHGAIVTKSKKLFTWGNNDKRQLGLKPHEISTNLPHEEEEKIEKQKNKEENVVTSAQVDIREEEKKETNYLEEPMQVKFFN